MGFLDRSKKKERTFATKLIISIVIIAIFVACIVSFILYVREDNDHAFKLDQDWDVAINDTVYEDVALSTFRIPGGIKRGDTIVLKNTLPDSMESDVSCMMFLIYLSTVDVKVDGDLVYSYGDEDYEDGFVGSGYHFIQLPHNVEGKEITIILKPSEDGAFTNIPVPNVVATRYAATTFTDTNMLNIFICIFLFMLGASITIVSAISLFFDNNAKRLVAISILATLIGAWSLCNMKVLQMFSTDLVANTVIEYILLFVAPIPLLIILIMVRQDEARWKKMVLYGEIVVIAGFDIIVTILHFANVVHFPKILSIFHVLAFGVLIIAIIAGRKKFSKMDNAEKMLNVAIIVLCVFAGADILRFNFSKYLWPENEAIANSILPFGTLLFVILLVASYLFYLYDMIKDKAETIALSMMAYTDPLTGLYNRAKAEKKFGELIKNKKDYLLINIDLNGLKKMNDKYGHERGDLLIKSFADILKDCFGDIATTVRMGGDEFLVIIESENEDKVKPALNKMIRSEAAKSKELEMRIEASFGLASNVEDPSRNPEQVYSVADQRMYAMKQRTKAERKARKAQKSNN